MLADIGKAYDVISQDTIDELDEWLKKFDSVNDLLLCTDPDIEKLV